MLSPSADESCLERIKVNGFSEQQRLTEMERLTEANVLGISVHLAVQCPDHNQTVPGLFADLASVIGL
jgi:hypothetical protein